MDVKSPYLEDSFIMDGPPLIYHMIRSAYDYSPLCGAASKITTSSTTRVTCENCLSTMRGKETIVSQVHYTRSQIDDMMAKLTKVIADNRETDNLAQNRLLQDHIVHFLGVVKEQSNIKLATDKRLTNIESKITGYKEAFNTEIADINESLGKVQIVTAELLRQTANVNARLDDIAGPAKETGQEHELVKLIQDGTYIWTCTCGGEVDTGYFISSRAFEDFRLHVERNS